MLSLSSFTSTELQMTSWHSKELGDGVDAFEPTRLIQEAYATLEMTTRLPVDHAVFSYYDLRANVVTVYFSPGATDLAKRFEAMPCKKPVNKEGFSLINGDARVWDVLFR